MRNICIFSPVFYPSIGGLERIGQLLATEWAQNGYRVLVITDTNGVTTEEDEKLRFQVLRTTEFRKIRLAFKSSDVIIFMNVSLRGFIPALLSRVPIVFSHHGAYVGAGFRGIFLEFLKRQVTRFYPNISVSNFVAGRIAGNSSVIHNAYDETIFRQPNIKVRRRDFVFCGRLVSEKGADNCVISMAAVLTRHPDATLTIVGDGPDREKLEILADRLGIRDSVCFTGNLLGTELVSCLQDHACMVVPSNCDEAFGIVALEGIACCTTVIVSSRGGLPEAVGDCGVIADPTEKELSAAMVAVVGARRASIPLPGEPTAQVRERHLAKHSSYLVARRYLDVISRAVVVRRAA